MIAELRGDTLHIEASAFPEANAIEIQTLIQESQAAFVTYLGRWKEDVAKRDAVAQMQE